jgi:sec-independent protein translocase protein TatA
MLGSLGFPELILILVIVALLFGGKKIPEVGKGLGEAIRNFKKGLQGDEKEITQDKPVENKDQNR